MVVTPLSLVWSATYVKEAFSWWKWPFAWLDTLEEFFIKNRAILAWIMIIYA
jgi:protein NrfD